MQVHMRNGTVSTVPNGPMHPSRAPRPPRLPSPATPAFVAPAPLPRRLLHATARLCSSPRFPTYAPPCPLSRPRRPRPISVPMQQPVHSSCATPPPPPPPPPSPHRGTGRFTVRVARRNSHHADDWAWTGAQTRLGERMLRALESSRITLLRVLRRVSHVIGRAFLPDDGSHVDLTIEYGIADPCPEDKVFVDPLADWLPAALDADPVNASGYYDAFDNFVQLQLTVVASSGPVLAADYRDAPDTDCDQLDPDDPTTAQKMPPAQDSDDPLA